MERMLERRQQQQQQQQKAAIQVAGLTKRFKEIKAVDSVSFTVDEGEIFGLLGPNGAGKTTTIRSIITLTKPTEGSIRVFGVDSLREPHDVRQMIGYVPQLISVDSQLTAYENLLIFSKLLLVDRRVRKERIREALEYMDLTERADDLVLHFSGGMMRRLEIAQALVNRPRILFLDEPSIGLDPTSKKTGWEYIKRLRKEFGVTVFITTHDMNEADELCDRIAIMNRGKIAVVGSPKELKSSIRGDVITLSVFRKGSKEEENGGGGGGESFLLPRELGSIVSAERQNGGDEEEEELIRVGTTEAAELAMPKLMEFVYGSGYGISSISVSKPNLDDVFTRYTKSTMGEEEATVFREARMVRRSFARHSG